VAVHSLRECRRAMERRGRLFAYLGYPVIPRLARMLAMVGRRDRFSTVEKRRWGCARGRAQSARVSASDGATRQAVCLPWVSGHTEACMHVWSRLVDGTDFRLSRNGGGGVPVAVHSLRECRRAMERRGRLFAYLGYPVIPRLARMFDAVGRRDRFSTVEKRRWECARGRAQSARVSASDGATRQAVCLPRVSGHTEACMHVGTVLVDGTDFRLSRKRSGENRAGGCRDVDAFGCAFVRARV
jgi:hypothetical protein